MVCFCGGVCDDAITGTRVVGIESAGYAVADRVTDGGAGKTADSCHRGKCAFNNQAKGGRDHGDMGHKDAQTADDIDHGHDGNDFFHNGGDSLEAAPDGQETGDAKHDDGNNGCNTETFLK